MHRINLPPDFQNQSRFRTDTNPEYPVFAMQSLQCQPAVGHRQFPFLRQRRQPDSIGFILCRDQQQRAVSLRLKCFDHRRFFHGMGIFQGKNFVRPEFQPPFRISRRFQHQTFRFLTAGRKEHRNNKEKNNSDSYAHSPFTRKMPGTAWIPGAFQNLSTLSRSWYYFSLKNLSAPACSLIPMPSNAVVF